MAEYRAKLAENYRTLSTFVSELGEQSFQVETSPFKDDLISEAGVLFCNTLSREPSKKDVKILGQKPYQAYAQLTTDEFADRFSNYVRAGSRHLVQYKINLAFLGKPSQNEIDTLVAEDFSFSYFSSTTPDNTSSDVHGSEENQAEEDLLYASYATVLPSEEQLEDD
eukprot:Em0007g760a